MILRKYFIVFLFSIFSLTVLGFGFYKALPIIQGPKIILTTPKNGEIVAGTSISISGTVYRAKSLYINNIPTAFSENGSFNTRLAIYPESNILILVAGDRFGRTITQTLNIGTK